MRRHDRLHAGLDRRAERRQAGGDVTDHRRQLEVRVAVGRAVAREVLRAAGDPVRLQAADVRRDVASDEGSVGAERAHADHGVGGVDVDVGDGCEIEVDAGRRKLGRDRRGDALRQLDVVHRPERGVPRVRTARHGVQPRHVAAFLVERDQELGALGAQRARERDELLAIAHVRAEEHDAADALGDELQEPVGRLRPFEAGEEALDHPRTAPWVRPKAIRRWTSRKKTTTGIAVNVDAAISPPQSVPRAVP